jgi:hypothetical protein
MQIAIKKLPCPNFVLKMPKVIEDLEKIYIQARKLPLK